MNVIDFADVFEASFHKLAGFFRRCGDFRDVVVVLEVNELRVHQRECLEKGKFAGTEASKERTMRAQLHAHKTF